MCETLAIVVEREHAGTATTRLLWTTFGRVDLIDADARIRLAMQASRVLTSAHLQVVQDEVRRAVGDASYAAPFVDEQKCRCRRDPNERDSAAHDYGF